MKDLDGREFEKVKAEILETAVQELVQETLIDEPTLVECLEALTRKERNGLLFFIDNIVGMKEELEENKIPGVQNRWQIKEMIEANREMLLTRLRNFIWEKRTEFAYD